MTLFGKIIGKPIGQFTIRLFPRNKDSNRDDWFEVILEPKIASGGKTYHAGLIYRNKELTDVANFGRKSMDMIENMISNIESI